MSVYNGEKIVAESIDSVLAQTYKDFEFLIINDGSTDGTKKILDQYSQRDKRIRVVSNLKNLGLAKALNIGLREAKGAYIIRTDADDISLPFRIEKQLSFMKSHPQYSVAGSWFKLLKENKKAEIIKTETDSKLIMKNLYYQNQLAHPTVIYKKKDIMSVGGYSEQYQYAQDYALWFSLLPKYALVNIPEVLVVYRLNENSSSMKFNKEQFFCHERIRKNNYFKAVLLTRGKVFWNSFLWLLFKKSNRGSQW